MKIIHVYILTSSSRNSNNTLKESRKWKYWLNILNFHDTTDLEQYIGEIVVFLIVYNKKKFDSKINNKI
jgi:hypothetical protein